MAFHFCPQCGIKLQPDFKFCPSCGGKLPCPEDLTAPVTSTVVTPSTSCPTFTNEVDKTSSFVLEPIDSAALLTSNPVSARPPLRKTRNSLRLDNLSLKDALSPVSTRTKVTQPNVTEVDKSLIQTTPPKIRSTTLEPSSAKPTQIGKCKSKRKAVEDVQELLSAPLSAVPSQKSPLKGKGKKSKATPALEPLLEGTEVTDTVGKKWKLVRLLCQTSTDIFYEVTPPNVKESNYTLKLGAKDGKIFNEQNFLQRAAKPATIEKWIKQNKMDFVGLPHCIGFGLHADSYRFLIFPNMGNSLKSLMSKQNRLLTEVAVLQIASRLLDIFLYIHSHEYAHADVNTENIYITEGLRSQVYLLGYNHAFRYCPGGNHVEHREGSRTPHEGAVEYISLDSHDGAGPTRRSDLQSLGYCMLHWHTGALPWTSLSQPQQIAAEKRKYIKDVPGLLRQCYGQKTVSRAFESFLSVVMALEYNELPDYAALKSGLTAALTQLGGSVEQPLSV